MGREVAGPASVRRYAILDVKRRGVVPPPLATCAPGMGALLRV